MKRLLLSLGITAAISSAASSSTLTIVPDLPYYASGDYYLAYFAVPFTLNIYGDAEGATANGIYGRLEYNGAIFNNLNVTQKLIGPGSDWTKGLLSSGDTNAYSSNSAFSEAFSQVSLSGGGQTATNPIATVTLIAGLIGISDVNWNTNTGSGLELGFFGLTSAPGVRVICCSDEVIPEPTTGALLALGLLALGSWRQTKLP
jgi:hypothetical protein